MGNSRAATNFGRKVSSAGGDGLNRADGGGGFGSRFCERDQRLMNG